ncbi:MAG: tRNA (N6-threonylcarbamoyladenosine(37)-N6)-methyltransferase TrmO [Clostridiales bacterium]|nr:tRNA (N6-threonylcarbamoyladenosine(37)-N6)-methyltransferase TrmO [Clostridiales bacterium]
MEIKPIAKIYTDFKEKFGIPRQSGRGVNLIGKIVFEPKYRFPEAIREIEKFSYLWLIFDFSLSHREEFSPTVRPPRLGGNTRVGVFASRSPFRPNSLGLSSVKLIKIEDDENLGKVLIVEGADILNETPIYDIKPYLLSDCHPDATVGYADTIHKLEVVVPPNLKEKIPKDKLIAVISCIEEDPRPSYHDDENRVYKMKFDNFEIHFSVKDNVATVKDVII